MNDPDDPFKPLSAKVQPKSLAAKMPGSGRTLSEKQMAAAARQRGHNVRKVDTKHPKGKKRDG